MPSDSAIEEQPRQTSLHSWRSGSAQAIALLRANLAALGPDKRLLTIVVGLSLVSGMVQTLLLFVLAMVAVAMSSARGAPPLFIIFGWSPFIPAERLLIAATVLTFVVLALAIPTGRMHATISARAGARARHRLVHAYLAADLDYRMRHREGYAQQLISEYCQNLTQATQQFVNFWSGIAALLMLLAVPVALNPKVGAAELVVICLALFAAGPMARRRRIQVRRCLAALDEMSAHTAQMARLADEIAGHHVGEAVARELDVQIEEFRQQIQRSFFRDGAVPQLYQFGALGTLLAAVALFFYVSPGPHPSLGAIALMLVRLLTYGRQVLSNVQLWINFAPTIERIDEELHAMEAHAEKAGTRRHVAFDGLQVEAMSFAYPSGDVVLRDVSLTVAPGEAIALVGPSGQGKSTLCTLIARLRRPSSGRILVGGVPIEQIAPARWAQLLAYVPQDPKLLFGSIADNIRFYRRGYSIERVEQAARAAHLHDEILALPQGYDTLVGPGLRGISGGQRQRLVIARALLGEPELLLLDEPSSALDKRSETLIVETLRSLRGRVSIVLITHRSTAMAICDRTYHFSGGRIAAIAPTMERKHRTERDEP